MQAIEFDGLMTTANEVMPNIIPGSNGVYQKTDFGTEVLEEPRLARWSVIFKFHDANGSHSKVLEQAKLRIRDGRTFTVGFALENGDYVMGHIVLIDLRWQDLVNSIREIVVEGRGVGPLR
jgi:hypothetical protein